MDKELATVSTGISPAQDDFQLPDAWRRAANDLSAGQIYLMDNPLLHGYPALIHRLIYKRRNRHGRDLPEIEGWRWAR